MTAVSPAQVRVGLAIRTYAKARGIKLKDIYEQMPMGKGPFYERLAGTTTLTLDELERIAEILNVEPERLLVPLPLKGAKSLASIPGGRKNKQLRFSSRWGAEDALKVS